MSISRTRASGRYLAAMVRAQGRRSLATLAALLLALIWVPGALTSSSASAASGATTVTPVPVNESCNGVLPTPGSGNTEKKLIGGTLQPGGTAIFEITYPIAPADVGQTFTVTDCPILGSNVSGAQAYQFSFVPNNTSFTVQFTLVIPAGTKIGTSYCNYAKTTASPSAPQASNRKAGPACFTVGGNLRIEKHAAGNTTDLLAGAQFRVSCPTAAPTTPPSASPVIVTGLVDASGGPVVASYVAGVWTAAGTANPGYIGISGPSGTVCTVTETAAPPGYVLPAVTTHEYTIPAGTSQVVEEWFNAPAASDLHVVKTSNPSNGSIVQPGQRIDYTITVTNTGSAPADGQTVTDTLPANVTVVPGSISPPPQTADATHIVWLVVVPPATAAGPGTVVLTYSVTVNADAPAGSTLTNVATLGGHTSTTQHHVPTGDLTLVKHVDKATAGFGDTLTYSFDAASTGTLNQTNVVVTDVVPAHTTYVAGSAGCTDAGTCTASYDSATNTVTWQLGDLAAGASRQLVFQVTIDQPTLSATGGVPIETILNSGVIGSTQTPSTPSNQVKTTTAAVLGITISRPPAVAGARAAATPAVSPSRLPFTGPGVPLALTVVLALGMIGAGWALVARRRPQQ